MNAFDDSLLRVIARRTNRAIPARNSSSISTDPSISVGIATIKIVTEDQIQAIAFGSLDREPEIVIRLDPIGRDVADLLPFAQFMGRLADDALAAEGACRVWIPHSVTLEALDILGHRYWRNQNAPAEIVRMGAICRTIAHEASFPDQQVVANGSALLQDHVVTGLSPIEEGHLGAALAWLDPSVADPLLEARERIRLPASGILPNTPDHPADNRVDRLRKEAKHATGGQRRILQAEIEDILRRWVLREWQMLLDARKAFLGLGLPSEGLTPLVKESKKRMKYALMNGHFPARQPEKLAALLAEMEAGLERTKAAALESDPMLRAQAQRAGGIVSGMVSEVCQPKKNRKPCDIAVDSEQGVIRFRIDDKVRVVGTNIIGIVRTLSATPKGGTRVGIEIQTGVRQTGVLCLGHQLELMREGFSFVPYQAFKLVNQRRPWAFFSDSAPSIAEGTSLGRSALDIAAGVRRP